MTRIKGIRYTPNDVSRVQRRRKLLVGATATTKCITEKSIGKKKTFSDIPEPRDQQVSQTLDPRRFFRFAVQTQMRSQQQFFSILQGQHSRKETRRFELKRFLKGHSRNVRKNMTRTPNAMSKVCAKIAEGLVSFLVSGIKSAAAM